MSSPKEKARELVDKMFLQIPSVYDPTNLPHYPIAKQCALICVDEILEATKKRNLRFKPNTVDTVIKYDAYWLEVKTEINNL